SACRGRRDGAIQNAFFTGGREQRFNLPPQLGIFSTGSREERGPGGRLTLESRVIKGLDTLPALRITRGHAVSHNDQSYSSGRGRQRHPSRHSLSPHAWAPESLSLPGARDESAGHAESVAGLP